MNCNLYSLFQFCLTIFFSDSDSPVPGVCGTGIPSNISMVVSMFVSFNQNVMIGKTNIGPAATN